MKEVKTFVSGPMANNTYLLIFGKEALIIDPSFNCDKLEIFITENNLKVLAILLTHGHYDHWLSLDKLAKKYDCPFYLSSKDNNFLGDEKLSLGQTTSLMPLDYPPILNISKFEIEVFETPGHSPGSVTLIWNENMFTGDFLFAVDIGRVDLPGGNQKEMENSLTMVGKWSTDYKLYPGHEESSTLFKEQKHNLYLSKFVEN